MCDKASVFVGNLPNQCNGEEVFDLFSKHSPVGRIIGVKVKCDANGDRNFEYGFVTFDSDAAALNAINAVNGMFYQGRRLRVSWATESSNSSMFVEPKQIKQESAQIHFSYISYNKTQLINEEVLFEYFKGYGTVIDLIIKKRKEDRGACCGYGFVRYELSAAGVYAALRAAHEMKDKSTAELVFDCSLSHDLRKKLRDFPELANYQPPQMQDQSIPSSEGYALPFSGEETVVTGTSRSSGSFSFPSNPTSPSNSFYSGARSVPASPTNSYYVNAMPQPQMMPAYYGSYSSYTGEPCMMPPSPMSYCPMMMPQQPMQMMPQPMPMGMPMSQPMQPMMPYRVMMYPVPAVPYPPSPSNMQPY